MLTAKERICALRAKAADFAKRAEEIEIEEAKKQVDERRKADSNAKLLLGAGVLLLRDDEQAHVIAAVLPRLSERDRGRVSAWAADRGMARGSRALDASSSAGAHY